MVAFAHPQGPSTRPSSSQSQQEHHQTSSEKVAPRIDAPSPRFTHHYRARTPRPLSGRLGVVCVRVCVFFSSTALVSGMGLKGFDSQLMLISPPVLRQGLKPQRSKTPEGPRSPRKSTARLGMGTGRAFYLKVRGWMSAGSGAGARRTDFSQLNMHIYTPRKRQTRAPVLTGVPGAAPGVWLRRTGRGICACRVGSFPIARDLCLCVCRH